VKASANNSSLTQRKIERTRIKMREKGKRELRKMTTLRKEDDRFIEKR